MSRLHRIVDIHLRNRALWAVPCWFIALTTAGIGIPFAFGGTKLTAAPSAYQAVQEELPGGIRTYGAVIALFGLVLAEGLVQPLHHQPMRDRQICVTLVLFVPFALSAAGGFVASWVLTGVTTWGYVLFWSLLAGLAAGTVWAAPDPPTGPQGQSSGAERVA